ncbi:MAG: head GIN domain-containing protein [Bacteroidota bacterium]
MKKAAFLFISISLVLNSCIIEGWNHGISGNGQVEEETRDVSGFTGVHVSTGIDVYLSEGDDFAVKVEADENLMEVILTEVNGDMLVIKTDRVNIRSAKSKKVFVTLPELEELKISSAGDCEGMTPFHCDDLRISISSAGDLSLDVEAERINVDISSSGDARISGRTRELDASLSSAGDMHAFDLIADKVDVSVSSAGDARVHATEEISMNASSAGNIYYRGDAQVVHSRSSSAGDIIKK